jgi:hypothetical protein
MCCVVDDLFEDLDAFACAHDVLGCDPTAHLLLLEHHSLRQVTQVQELVELARRVLLTVPQQQRQVALVALAARRPRPRSRSEGTSPPDGPGSAGTALPISVSGCSCTTP